MQVQIDIHPIHIESNTKQTYYGVVIRRYVVKVSDIVEADKIAQTLCKEDESYSIVQK